MPVSLRQPCHPAQRARVQQAWAPPLGVGSAGVGFMDGTNFREVLLALSPPVEGRPGLAGAPAQPPSRVLHVLLAEDNAVNAALAFLRPPIADPVGEVDRALSPC